MSVSKPKYFSLEHFKGDYVQFSQKFRYCAICVPKKYGLWWSLVLALLFPVKKKEKFKTSFRKLVEACRLQTIIPSVQPKEVEHLFDFLKQYNPFLDRQSCFDNNTLKTLVMILRQKAETELGNSPCMDLHSLLQTACQLLERNVVSCEAYEYNSYVRVFPFFGDNELPEVLTLYFESESDDFPPDFSHFVITERDGEALQKKALVSILRFANFTELWIEKVKTTLTLSKDIPKKLITNEMYEAVVLLYKQPHTLLKLEEACYVVDPFIFDENDESAFSSSLQNKNARFAVYTFFNYLSSLERNPDLYLTQRLVNAKYVLETNRNMFMENKRERSVLLTEQLLEINKFRAAVVEKLSEISKLFPSSSASSDNLREVMRRRTKIMDILLIYFKYFSFNYNAVAVPPEETKLFKHLQGLNEITYPENHVLYFQVLDTNVALLLFDDLFFLKYKLKHDLHELRVYEHVESKCLQYLFTCAKYGLSPILYPSTPERQNEGSDRQQEPSINESFLHNVIFERREFYQSLKKFRNHIARAPMELETKTQAFSTLTSVPITHDVAILRTILRYLNNLPDITDNETTENDFHAIEVNQLVIERLLQVIGENLKECAVENVTMIKSLLMSSFPLDVRNDICTIRDALAHVAEGTNAEKRLRAERNFAVFFGIRDELNYFLFQCKEFIEIAELQMNEDILLRDDSFRKGVLERYHRTLEKGNSTETVKNIRHRLENRMRTEEIEKPHSIRFIRHQLREMEFFRDRCKQHFEVHFSYMRHYMKKALDEPFLKEKHRNSVLFYIRCIEILFVRCIEILTENSSEIAFFFPSQEVRGVLNKIETIARSYIEGNDPNEAVLTELRVQEEHLMEVYDNICKTWSSGSSRREDFSSIKTLRKYLTAYCPLLEEEKAVIIEKVPHEFINHSKAKSNLISMAKQILEGQEISFQIVETEIQRLLPSSLKERLLCFCSDRNLTQLCLSSDVEDPFVAFKNILDKNELIRKRDYEFYCSIFGWSENEDALHLLKKFVSGDPFKTRKHVPELQKSAHFRFLSNRVKSLQRLFISSNPRIFEMWIQAKNPEEEQHAQVLIVQKFLIDKRFQAAVEMLFFDCMSIQKYDAELKNLWIKTSYLFSGINLRNLLAHNDPLIPELGWMLDPDDLATEIISKCLIICESAKARRSQNADL